MPSPPPPPVACLAAAPPEPPLEVVVGCTQTGYAACLSRESLERLAAYLMAVREWDRDAWAACGPG